MKRRSIIVLSLLMTVGLFKTVLSQEPGTQIKINQVGYYINAPKIAVITGKASGDKFYLVGAVKKDTVLVADIGAENKSAYSSTITRIADFGSFRKTGNFMLYVPGIGNSYPFTIKNSIHHDVAIASLRGYYYQRVSMPLEKKYAGKWNRPAGHPDDKVLIHPSAATTARPAGTIISSPGGWYDAGDYNKYIVNSGITMGTLLAAYEDFPDYFLSLTTNIPESSNSIPDILDEALYNLRWMLTMQDPNDGGVYNKCTNASFDGMVMPGVTKLPRYVVQKGTAATLDFAAVTHRLQEYLRNFQRSFPG
jgi:endoglucanase